MTAPSEALVVQHDEQPMDVVLVKQQVQHIQAVMKEVMVKDTHYGTIPGTDKPTLYKPGAEVLGLTFRLDPTFRVEQTDVGNGHREYEVRCVLFNQGSGRTWEGVGFCSTMESKYRYRGVEKVFTEKKVPSKYWDIRKKDPKAAQELLGGKGFITGKSEDDGQWYVCTKGIKSENPDIADVYNTVLKMAKKRSHTDAILTATACSDIFTQDLEPADDDDKKQDKKAEPKRRVRQPERKSEAKPAAKVAEPGPNTTDGPPTDDEQPAADDNTGTWEGLIVDVRIQEGETERKGKMQGWTLYRITGDDQSGFITFSDTDGMLCQAAMSNEDRVVIGWEKTSRGGMKITSIDEAPPE